MPMLKKGFHVVALDLPGDWFDWLLFLGFCWLVHWGGVVIGKVEKRYDRKTNVTRFNLVALVFFGIV